MNLSILEIILITFFGVLLLLVLYCELLCIKRIRTVEKILIRLSPLVGHEKTSLAKDLTHTLEALKEINRLFALRAQQDKPEDKRVLN